MNLPVSKVERPSMLVRDLLHNVATELRSMKIDGERLEHAIGQAILSQDFSTRDALTNLQGIDLMVQSLGELGCYVEGLADLVDKGEIVDPVALFEGVKLRGLAINLLNGNSDTTEVSIEPSCGDVDLF